MTSDMRSRPAFPSIHTGAEEIVGGRRDEKLRNARMTSLHLSVSELVEGGFARLTANLFAVFVFTVANVTLMWGFLWAETSIEVPLALTVLGFWLATFVVSSLLVLALGGKLRMLLRDPEELLTRIVFAGAAGAISFVGIGVGLIFLIVPGVYLSARWFVAAELILLDGNGILEGLGQSMSLTEASVWPLAGMTIILAVPSMLLSFLGSGPDFAPGVPGAGLVVQWIVSSGIAAFGAAVGVFAWHRLSGQTDELQETFA